MRTTPTHAGNTRQLICKNPYRCRTTPAHAGETLQNLPYLVIKVQNQPNSKSMPSANSSTHIHKLFYDLHR